MSCETRMLSNQSGRCNSNTRRSCCKCSILLYARTDNDKEENEHDLDDVLYCNICRKYYCFIHGEGKLCCGKSMSNIKSLDKYIYRNNG